MTMHLRERLQSSLGSAYTLERELGGGGMSRVFVATETALGRRVVVKVLPPEMAVGVSAERFAREIQLAARLQHPHIVPVLAAGSWDGVPFYTMPWVEGESLRAHLRRAGALSVPQALRVLRDVARALAYAHRQGVLHRDVKPDNVLLSDGSALVTDFGVAKALDDALDCGGGLDAGAFDGGGVGEGSGLTSMRLVVGTPAYVAPEQAAGDASADCRVDVYAFGATAYELLTGVPPFAGRSPRGMVTAHMVEVPRPIGERRSDLPPALAKLIMCCLEKEPARRPRSADELLRALDSLIAPLGRRTRRLLIRRTARWAGSVVTGTAVGVGAAGVARTDSGAALHHAWVVRPRHGVLADAPSGAASAPQGGMLPPGRAREASRAERGDGIAVQHREYDRHVSAALPAPRMREAGVDAKADTALKAIASALTPPRKRARERR